MSPQEIIAKILASAPPRQRTYLADPEPESDTVKIGQFYAIDNEPYILAQPSPRQCCLINLIGGNRWNDPIPVVNVNAITQAEFSRMAPIGRLTVTRIH